MEPEPRNETADLAEKVRFWQEQDRINQALIPRVLHLHEAVLELARRVEELSSRLDRAEAVEAGLEALRRESVTPDALERLRAQVRRQQVGLLVLGLLAAVALAAAVWM